MFIEKKGDTDNINNNKVLKYTSSNYSKYQLRSFIFIGSSILLNKI